METTEIHYLDANKPRDDFILLHPRENGIRYGLDHYNGIFYILSNENAPSNKVMSIPVSNPVKENWQECIPHRADVLVENIDLFTFRWCIAGE